MCVLKNTHTTAKVSGIRVIVESNGRYFANIGVTSDEWYNTEESKMRGGVETENTCV